MQLPKGEHVDVGRSSQGFLRRVSATKPGAFSRRYGITRVNRIARSWTRQDTTGNSRWIC